MTAFAAWATPERASKALRLFILLLMILIPLAAIYALAMGGAGPQRDMMFIRDGGPMHRPGMHWQPAQPLFNKEVREECTTKNGVRTCTRTERDLKPGERLAPAPAAPVAPPETGRPSPTNFIRTQFDGPPPPPEGGDVEMRVFGSPPPGAGPGPITIPLPPPPVSPADIALSALSLLFVLGILFNIERLLLAFEKGAVFSESTVRRLQHTGIFVAALGFLPQIDIFELLRHTAFSLVTGAHVGPLPLAQGGINIALVLAGVLTVLIARIVHEANALAEDVRGTV